MCITTFGEKREIVGERGLRSHEYHGRRNSQTDDVEKLLVPVQRIRLPLVIPEKRDLAFRHHSREQYQSDNGPLAERLKILRNPRVDVHARWDVVVGLEMVERAHCCRSWVAEDGHLQPIIDNWTTGFLHAAPNTPIVVHGRTALAAPFAKICMQVIPHPVIEWAVLSHGKLVLPYLAQRDGHPGKNTRRCRKKGIILSLNKCSMATCYAQSREFFIAGTTYSSIYLSLLYQPHFEAERRR